MTCLRVMTSREGRPLLVSVTSKRATSSHGSPLASRPFTHIPLGVALPSALWFVVDCVSSELGVGDERSPGPSCKNSAGRWDCVQNSFGLTFIIQTQMHSQCVLYLATIKKYIIYCYYVLEKSICTKQLLSHTASNQLIHKTHCFPCNHNSTGFI